jgi:hypothetical protein
MPALVSIELLYCAVIFINRFLFTNNHLIYPVTKRKRQKKLITEKSKVQKMPFYYVIYEKISIIICCSYNYNLC